MDCAQEFWSLREYFEMFFNMPKGLITIFIILFNCSTLHEYFDNVIENNGLQRVLFGLCEDSIYPVNDTQDFLQEMKMFDHHRHCFTQLHEAI